MVWKYKKTNHGSFGDVPYTDISHKCPCCKKKTNFKRIDVSSDRGMVYCEGENMPLYRCDKCWIIIGVGEEDKNGNKN